MTTPKLNFTLTPLLRGVTAIETLVLLVFGGGLFFLPAIVRPIWPWVIPPFNASYLGAIYVASFVATGLMVVYGTWSPGRLVTTMIFAFTTIAMLISLAYAGNFAADHTVTVAGWWVLYVGIPLNTGIHLWLYRKLPSPASITLTGAFRALLQIAAALMALYSLGMLAFPAAFSSFWPWGLDDFHARLYIVNYISPAVGLFIVSRGTTRAELLTLGATLSLLGFLQIAGLYWVDVSVNKVNWAAGGTWLWIGHYALIGLLGLALLWRSRRE